MPPLITFRRSELARILLASVSGVNDFIRRDQVPTLIGVKRPALTAFDAWMATVSDCFCRSGGHDRTFVARAQNRTDFWDGV